MLPFSFSRCPWHGPGSRVRLASVSVTTSSWSYKHEGMIHTCTFTTNTRRWHTHAHLLRRLGPTNTRRWYTHAHLLYGSKGYNYTVHLVMNRWIPWVNVIGNLKKCLTDRHINLPVHVFFFFLTKLAAKETFLYSTYYTICNRVLQPLYLYISTFLIWNIHWFSCSDV
jgi:hypothetical protein